MEQQQQQPFNGLCSGATRVGRYQKQCSYGNDIENKEVFSFRQSDVSNTVSNLDMFQQGS